MILIRVLLLSLLMTPIAVRASGDLPPSGYSLFDYLFSKPADGAYRYHVPYPFEELLRQLEARAAALEDDAGSPLVAVLIPRGRSLQREAASPDYYRFPRVVVALDRESRLPLPLKNRLFLGYQEKSKTIEVISYNNQAGRFEFQVVENYDAGGQPSVRYANRDLCTSCHQNRAPIFARPRWRESNFRPEVAERIAEHGPSYHGIKALADKGDAARFDFATDQAGLFNAYQNVWQHGCDGDVDERDNQACRAGLFLAAIQQAIASIPRPQYRSDLIEHKLLPLVQRNWERRWPRGMPVASADIDDREAPAPGTEERLTPGQDPLNHRPPLANWGHKPALRRTIQGIGEQFLPLRDLIRLNAGLMQQVGAGRVPQRDLDGRCNLDYVAVPDRGRWVNLDCRFDQAGADGISIEGELWQDKNRDHGSAQGKMLITGTAGWARVEVSGRLQPSPAPQLRFELTHPSRPGAARLWDNRIVSGLVISGLDSSPAGAVELAARIRLSDDFSLVEGAVYRMLEDSVSGRTELFARRPLRGDALMRALLQKLGTDAGPPMPRPLGLARVGTRDGSAGATLADALPAGSPLRILFRRCGACHASPARIPPGFLHGGISRVQQQLSQCAPRIALRLALWQQQPERRPRSPMPPPSSFPAEGDDLAGWRDSDEFQQLANYIQTLLPGADSDAITIRNYERLPPCFADKPRHFEYTATR